jgi:crossover junction endodeoxyribonuclease RusA
MIEFNVRGLPQPQGSSRAFVSGGRARIVTGAHAGPLGYWRHAIATEARAAMGDRPLLEGPLVVILRFRLPRPKSAPKRQQFPDRRPDIDKLARAGLDALTGVVLRDDAQVIELSADKSYGEPGVTVRVGPA